MLNHLYSTALLGEIEKTLDELCRESNKLLISEFNRRISAIVREQPAPFIYERLGERYFNYLIDEFQDTSVLQWHNLLPLIENSLASNRMNLVVGDAKQAIYRFRAGDAQQLEILPSLIKENGDDLLEFREQMLTMHYQQENLNVNRRSSKTIVDFNNSFFTTIAGHLPVPFKATFENASQEVAKKDSPGMVRIERVTEIADGELSYDDLVLDKVFEILEELKSDNFPLKDIAILCRDNKKSSKIASFLAGKGIAVISSDSLLLARSEEVNFHIAWIRHLVDPNDSNPPMQIIHYLTKKQLLDNVKLEDLFGKKIQYDAVKFNESLSVDFPFLEQGILTGLEIFGLVQYLVFHFGLNRFDNSYLRFFQDLILDFVQKKNGSLAEFLEWWEEKQKDASIIIPEGIQAVRVMTIHKAKGLQFPAVIYPYADETLRFTKSHLWVPLQDKMVAPLTVAYFPANNVLQDTVYKEMYEDEKNRSVIDMVNVLYVAMTRPEERLYVICDDFPEKQDGKESVSKYFSYFFQVNGIYEKVKEVYQFGDRWERQAAAAKEDGKLQQQDTEPGRPVLNMLLRPHAPQAWDVSDPAKNREWGNLVHLAMSRVKTSADIVYVLDGLLEEGLISRKQSDEFLVLLTDLVSSPEVSGFFAQGYEVRNEPEILTGDGVLYRPDRVLIRDNSVIIIDYKTGSHRKEHNSQVEEYATLMRQMDYRVDGAYLLYLNRQPEVVRVI